MQELIIPPMKKSECCPGQTAGQGPEPSACCTPSEAPAQAQGSPCCAPSCCPPPGKGEHAETLGQARAGIQDGPCCPPSCCPPPDTQAESQARAQGGSCCASSCCAPPALPEIPGYRRWHFVTGFLDTPAGRVPQVSTALRTPDRLGAAGVRLGVGRGRYRVAPGLYAVGQPTPQSPVLVTANYKLSFDSLRRELSGQDAWILVLDTNGVNVWCAAGKKTFGTTELARRVELTGLARVVSHRVLVVPQLGAPGVAGHEVRRLCGFRVVFGPVRAADVPRFLQDGMKATPEMRRVRFGALDRVLVGLVEFANERRTMAMLAAALLVVAGIGLDVFSLTRALRGLWTGGAAYALGFVAGNVLTPLALPLLPGRALSLKGAVAGALAGSLVLLMGQPPMTTAGMWLGAVVAGSWYAMQFTGSTTYTSPSGVEREMRRALPLQAVALVLALVLWRVGLGG